MSDQRTQPALSQITAAQANMLRKMDSENIWASRGHGTARVLHARGLIEVRRSSPTPFDNKCLWRLTAAGREWLRSNPKELSPT